MMTERKTVPFIKPPADERESGERVFSTDPDLLRAENARLQTDLTRALEERNRLLKSRGLPSDHNKGAGLRILEERLESTRTELDRFRQEHKVQEEKIRILQERLTATGRIPGIFIAKLEDTVISSDGICNTAGSPVENAADGPDRVTERFDAALDALWQVVKHNRVVRDNLLRQDIEKLRVSLEYKKKESDILREERDRLGEQLEDLRATLQRSEAEVALRDEKLAELRGWFEEQDEVGKKQAGTILKLKNQIKNLRGSVDAELYAHVTGAPGTSMMGISGWKSILFSRAALSGLLLGVVLAGGGLWLSGGFKPAVVMAPEEVAPPLSEPEAQTATLAIGGPTAEKPGGRFVPEVHRDALRSGGRGPVLIKLPGNSFTMGTDRYAPPKIEKPAHPERLVDFYIGRFEVSFDEYDAFARASGLEPPPDQGWGRGSRPVINVAWDSARAYTTWLSRQTGHRYRLPSEAEWEYAMGGGSGDFYWWGNTFEQGREICFNCGTRWDGRGTAPVGSARANLFGLYDMGGNVMEWVEDCLAADAAAPDGCAMRVVRGGAFNKPGYSLRTTTRRGLEADSGYSTVGFRVVREVGE